jgi:tripeptidyl-peptidase-1
VLQQAASLPSHATHVIHEKRQITSSQWVKRSKVPPHQVLPVRIGLAQKNLDRGHDFLMDMYVFLSYEKGENLKFYPAPIPLLPISGCIGHQMRSPKRSLHQWRLLTSSGFNKSRITHSQNKGWLAFDAQAEEVEGLLHTKYHHYKHISSGHAAIACDEWAFLHTFVYTYSLNQISCSKSSSRTPRLYYSWRETSVNLQTQETQDQTIKISED